jgi:signal peptidase II
MNANPFRNPAALVACCAVAILALDQATKWSVMRLLPLGAEREVLEGFFKFVHWGNTGAAWSFFRHQNGWLALFSAAAMFALWFFRAHFEFHRRQGQVALGLLFGGIAGNLVDRLMHEHVVDFLRFYWIRRGGGEIGFPAFNVADSAICTAVGLLLLLSWSPEPGDTGSAGKR